MALYQFLKAFEKTLSGSKAILCLPPKIFAEQRITYDIYWNAY